MPKVIVTEPNTWTITIHRFQPKTGKHRNQTFELAGSSDAALKSTMTLAFGEANQAAMYDLVARTHAVLRIEILSDRNHVDIWTAPVVIRPYVEKLPKDYTDLTKKVYAPADDTSWMDDAEVDDSMRPDDRCKLCGSVRLMHDQAMHHRFYEKDDALPHTIPAFQAL